MLNVQRARASARARACGLAASVAALATPALSAEPADALRGATSLEAQGSAASGAVLLALTIDGATVYSPADLALYYETYLTHNIAIDDLVRIAQAITDRYRADGYFLSRAVVPEQNLEAGLARIIVIEGRISSVGFEGDGAPQAARLLADLASDGPARLDELDRRLALANDARNGMTVREALDAIRSPKAEWE